MSIARHHAEWLSLVPVSGPFLSLPVLMEAFPQELIAHEPEHARLLRQEYTAWQGALEKRKADPAPHHHWIRFVLTRTLDLDDRVLAEGQAIPQTLQVEIPEHHEWLRPSLVVIDPNTAKPRLLVQTYPRSQELTSYVGNSPWKASPDTRMTELLHATGVRLGLVTNGEHWMLVDAPRGETTGYASWYAALWLEESITLRAFRSLLSASRFFGVPDDQTLEALLAKSASNQQEVTEQLGYQVRRAVEVLVHSLDRADQDYGRELLAGVREEILYEAALTVMMRLVFLFCAEERELIPSKPFPVYEQNYSVSTISKQLRELADQHGEELLEYRQDAWPRLLAAFRAVYGGLQHDDLHIPAYGGNLFNPDRFPFLEGRKLGTSWRDSDTHPLPVNNRTVLHLLEALQLLQVKVPGGGPAEARRVSFRALDIEQIGHVYEGLLDHTAKRATEPFLGLAGPRDKEPEIPLAELERLVAKGEADLFKFLNDETGRSESALKKAFKAEIDDQLASRFRTACQRDDALWARVRPFAGLVRLDNFGYPVVIPKGSIFVTAGTDRRSSGTHYTPRSLTEPVVQYTLEPLVYVGPAEGKPKHEWVLKSAKELLDLKICDMACGSGAFLVQAARYMSERLMEAWELAKQANPDTPNITPEGEPSLGKADEALIPEEPAERKTYAMRIIAQRCLYGVDKNPLATEMAKLSLWLLTLAKDKPFEFLDHAIRCGDSLVGLHDLAQLRHYSLKPEADDAVLFAGPLDGAVDEAISLRLKLEDLPANTVEDIERQEKLLREAEDKIARLRCAADLLVAAEFWGGKAKDKQERTRHNAVRSGYYVEKGPTEEFQQVAAQERQGQAMFHWPLEFPEVMVKRGGFDGLVGNPPFLGGLRISEVLSDEYNTFLFLNNSDASRKSDLVSHFVYRAYLLVTKSEGIFGFLGTNTIAEGLTKKAGLGRVIDKGGVIYKTCTPFPWPGDASVQAVFAFVSAKKWDGHFFIDDKLVDGISESLMETELSIEKAAHLEENSGKCYVGSLILSTGFLVSPEQAKNWIDYNIKNKEVLFPSMGGREFNDSPTFEVKRWAINFGEMTKSEVESYNLPFEHICEHVWPERKDKDAEKYPRMVNEWWKYWHARHVLYNAIKPLKRVLVRSRVCNRHMIGFVPSCWVYSDALTVFAFEDFHHFAVLQSSIHEAWVNATASTMRTDVRYVESRCFGAFPFPKNRQIDEHGEIFYLSREATMLSREEGLTKIYSRFHNSSESSDDIQKLRELYVEMDKAVSAAYGWGELDLDHGFHETKQGIRFTISESACRKVLQRLLKLNHERYAEEVASGLHDKKASKPTPAKRALKPKPEAPGLPAKPDLFGGGQLDVFGSLEPDPIPAAETTTPDLLEYLQNHPGWHSKDAILKGSGFPENRWNSAIKELLASQQVEREGEKRGARYRFRQA